ncbi:DUF2007 domain-containing protein [Pedobacter sp. PLR]|uniref:putative signal transducing protein n=1 Tax=Pedobacter sp. PLR TaxID=2994465 RepID=UPI0022470C82|nr:DUF2007 domain-containing protein [Pedobacter sp. PLR]MCX2450786.1 DUF2007 domain-containing protein [Pedobacter sp. PLR]
MDKIIVFETFYNPIKANIVKSRLLDSGLQCFLSDEHTIGMNPLYTQALGGIKLHVFERDLEQATAILQEEGFAPGFVMSSDGGEEEVPVEETAIVEKVCPNCGSTHVGYVQSTKKRFGILTMVISFLLAVYPFHVNKTWHCFDCEHEFEE